MNTDINLEFQLFPEKASTIAERVDALYLGLVGVSLFFTVLICVLILTFGIRYRRGSRVRRANPPKSNLLEVLWAVVPLVVSLGAFAWGATVYFEMRNPPEDALEIEVVGKQWMWKVQHANGTSEINELHVPVGQPVRLRMISEDVIHSFYIPVFRVKQDVIPGYYTTLWFEANRTGTYHLFCAEYCGTEHSLMRGTVTVMDVDAYADWLAGETGEPPEVAGKQLYERFRCGSCHKRDGSGTGPSLVGIYGRAVPLASGQTVTADEQYLRNSILDPASQIVAGHRPVMPSFRGQINESQTMKLIAYLKSLTMDAPQQPAQEAAPSEQNGQK